MKPKPYIINIIRCPTVFLSRVFSVILSAHYAFPKLNRVLKPGTCALWCEFSHTAVLEVSRASLSLSSRPLWRAVPVTFCHLSACVGRTWRQPQRLVEPLRHYPRSRRRFLFLRIAVPVEGAGKFFYVTNRRHDSRGDRRLFPSVLGQTFIERHRSLPAVAGRSAARRRTGGTVSAPLHHRPQI